MKLMYYWQGIAMAAVGVVFLIPGVYFWYRADQITDFALHNAVLSVAQPILVGGCGIILFSLGLLYIERHEERLIEKQKLVEVAVQKQ
jgi:predicted dinucleotide-utilizing enzyme